MKSNEAHKSQKILSHLKVANKPVDLIKYRVRSALEQQNNKKIYVVKIESFRIKKEDCILKSNQKLSWINFISFYLKKYFMEVVQ